LLLHYMHRLLIGHRRHKCTKRGGHTPWTWTPLESGGYHMYLQVLVRLGYWTMVRNVEIHWKCNKGSWVVAALRTSCDPI
jgi:hypothetical protein